MIVVFVEITAKPMRKVRVDQANGLAENPLAERGSTAARVVRDHHRKPWIGRPGPEGGLSQSRMPNHGHMFGVDRSVCLKIVERPAQSPRPCRNGSPFIGLWG